MRCKRIVKDWYIIVANPIKITVITATNAGVPADASTQSPSSLRAIAGTARGDFPKMTEVHWNAVRTSSDELCHEILQLPFIHLLKVYYIIYNKFQDNANTNNGRT